MQRALAQAGYRTTREVEFGEETIFIWHPAYDAGMTALGWAINFAGWQAYGRPIDESGGVHLGLASSLDHALATVIAWAEQHKYQWLR